MLLVEALVHHEGPLLASLRAEYGIDLRNPPVGARDLALLTEQLPPGCALWRSIGGPLAWSTADHALHVAVHELQILAWQQTKDGQKNQNRPDPFEPPKYAHEQRAAADRFASKAAAHRARTRSNQ